MSWKRRNNVRGIALSRDGITYIPDVNHKKAAFSFVLLGQGKKGRAAVQYQAERISATDGNAWAHGCESMAACKRLLGVRVHAATWGK
jgi:hypothetical protein